MNDITTTRSVDVIAAEINHIKNETKAMVINNSIEIGRRLVEAKSIIGHGRWGDWLEESVNYSQRTAQNLMKIFEEYGSKQISLFGDSNSQAFADLNYSQAIALLAIRDIEEREQFVEDNNVKNMSTRELQEAIKEKQKAEEEKEKALKLAEDLKKQANKIEQEKAKLESDIRIKEESIKLNQENIGKLQDTLERERESSKTQLEKLKETIKNTKGKLKEAKQLGNNEEVGKLQEEINIKETEISEYMQKVKELEERLKDKPVDVEVVEKIPEEIEKELKQLREKVGLGDMTSRFKMNFNMIQTGFNGIFKALGEMPEDVQEKYKDAVKVLIDKMGERL